MLEDREGYPIRGDACRDVGIDVVAPMYVDRIYDNDAFLPLLKQLYR